MAYEINSSRNHILNPEGPWLINSTKSHVCIHARENRARWPVGSRRYQHLWKDETLLRETELKKKAFFLQVRSLYPSSPVMLCYGCVGLYLSWGHDLCRLSPGANKRYLTRPAGLEGGSDISGQGLGAPWRPQVLAPR